MRTIAAPPADAKGCASGTAATESCERATDRAARQLNRGPHRVDGGVLTARARDREARELNRGGRI